MRIGVGNAAIPSLYVRALKIDLEFESL